VVDRRQQQNSGKGGKSDKNQANDGQHGSDDEPDWMREFVVKKDNHVEEKNIKMKKFGKGDKRRNQESCRDLFSRVEGDRDLDTKKERNFLQKNNDAVELTDEEFLLEDYKSEEEGACGKSKRKAGGGSLSSPSDEEEEEDQSDEEEDKEKLKVYFCSRTHSQLSQFVKELRKTVFSNEMKIVCLGSRKNFCINEGLVNCSCVGLFLFGMVLQITNCLWNMYFRGIETWKLLSNQ
jgi:chromosome transmission fidelity protein 1